MATSVTPAIRTRAAREAVSIPACSHFDTSCPCCKSSRSHGGGFFVVYFSLHETAAVTGLPSGSTSGRFSRQRVVLNFNSSVIWCPAIAPRSHSQKRLFPRSTMHGFRLGLFSAPAFALSAEEHDRVIFLLNGFEHRQL